MISAAHYKYFFFKLGMKVLLILMKYSLWFHIVFMHSCSSCSQYSFHGFYASEESFQGFKHRFYAS